MVKKILKFFSYLLFFVFVMMVFIPKSSFYFSLEENLKTFNIVISKETLDESVLSLNIHNLEISAKNIQSAIVEDVDVTLLFLYNSVTLTNIKLSSLVEGYLPSKVDKLQLTYTIFDPLLIKVQAQGEFGEMQADINILDKNISVELTPTNIMLKRYKKSIKMFKKSKDGVYVYAKSF